MFIPFKGFIRNNPYIYGSASTQTVGTVYLTYINQHFPKLGVNLPIK